MCTVVCRRQPGRPGGVRLLALRDEFVDRSFDLPDRWWPEQPGVVGGRDRTAGGSWCVTDVATGTTAVVLNRPEPRTAAPGAQSRGVLPLAAARFGARWPEHVDVTGMAGFHLVLVAPDAAAWWSFDGGSLAHEPLDPGTQMFSPRGRVVAGAHDRFAAAQVHPDDEAAPADEAWREWLDVLHEAGTPSGAGGLIVRREVGGRRYETVFGQLIAARPGLLRLDFLERPADGLDRPWTTRIWQAG